MYIFVYLILFVFYFYYYYCYFCLFFFKKKENKQGPSPQILRVTPAKRRMRSFHWAEEAVAGKSPGRGRHLAVQGRHGLHQGDRLEAAGLGSRSRSRPHFLLDLALTFWIHVSKSWTLFWIFSFFLISSLTCWILNLPAESRTRSWKISTHVAVAVFFWSVLKMLCLFRVP